MSTEAQIALWAVACCAPLLLNIGTRRGADAIGLSAMLVATWCFGRVCGLLFTVPESMTLYPIEDALCGAVCMAAWRSQKARWKLVLAALFVVQCCLHAAFWLAWERAGKQALVFYLTANNAIFALQLITAGWGALAHVAVSAFARLPGVARGVHHGRSGP